MENKQVIVFNSTPKLRELIGNSNIRELISYETDSVTKNTHVILERNGNIVARIGGGGDITVEDIKEALNDNFNTDYQVD